MSAQIILPAILSRYLPKADRSFSITFGTNELTPDQLLVINSLHNQHVYLLIKDSGIDQADREIIEGLEPDLDGFGKSLSQRLRNVLFVEFKGNPQGYGDFDSFYRARMEKAIQTVKNRLQPQEEI